MAHYRSRRYRGQKEAGSCTARTVARMSGLAAAAVLSLASLAPAGAQAASHGNAGDPSPQPAPVSTGAAPSPDPAPQAATQSTPSHASTPSTPPISQVTPSVSSGSGGGSGQPVVSSPVAPAHASSTAPPSDRVRTHSAPAQVSHRVVRHAPAARRPSTRVGPLSFPLSLPRALLLIPRAGAPAHRNGLLLLLSSVAMAVVAVASFAMLRRLRRLEAA
jgi:hypothetical protein